MNKELQGLCLCLAALGFTYVLLMLILMLLSGAKLFKTIALVSGISTLLFGLGLSNKVKRRMKEKLHTVFQSRSTKYSVTKAL
jgi:hypothetical protein